MMLPEELTVIWTQKFSAATVLYLTVRYFNLGFWAVTLLLTFVPGSPLVCFNISVTHSQAKTKHCRRQWFLLNSIYWKLNSILRCSALFYLSVTLTYVGIIPLKGMRNHLFLVLLLKLVQAVFILHTWAIYRRNNIVLCVLCTIVSVSLIADMV